MDLNEIDFNKIFRSKIFVGVLYFLTAALVVLVIFRAGMAVGFRKANFSYQMGDNYHRNFAGPRRGFSAGFGERDFVEAHGSIGQIIKIDNQSLAIKGSDGLEKIILVTDRTIINRFRDTIALKDLKVDDLIVVIGEPNNSGQIEARLVRVMPNPPTGQPQLLSNPPAQPASSTVIFK